MPRPVDNNEYKEFFHKTKNQKFKTCLWHTENCQNKPIKAHSVQNRAALDHLVDDGHVIMVKAEVKECGVYLCFEKIGRNVATTFTGLCADHDAELFRPIDLNHIDLNNPEHLFLLAYRSILKEFHSSVESAGKVQAMYQRGIDLGAIPEQSDAVMEATLGIAGAYLINQTLTQYRNSFVKQMWGAVKHEAFVIDKPPSLLAASGFFLPVEAESVMDPENPTFLTMNVVPQSGDLLVVFSWTSDHDEQIYAAINPILRSIGDYQLYLLSKFILKYTETFVLKPTLYEKLGERQVREIKKYFLANAVYQRDEWDDERLFLFGPIDG